jgi:hypothetical protein
MATIAPNTTIYLIKAPIEADQLNIIKFANQTAQLNYFLSLPHLTLTNATYQRDDDVVRFSANAEDIRDYNYCIYQNTAYGNKWIYAFITNIEYYSNDSCGVSLQTDFWNTWQHDITFRQSFVEREHVNDDTFGLHTIPEGLEYGDYICNGVQQVTYADPTDANSLMIAFQVMTPDVTPDNGHGTDVFPTSTANIHNGIPQGCAIFGMPYTQNAAAQISFVTGLYDAAGKGNAIVSIFLIPRACCAWTAKQGTGRLAVDGYYVPNDTMTANTLLGPEVIRNTSLDGYVPHNNKLFCAPYNALYLTNNAGADCTYQYELFNGNPTFSVQGALEQGGAIKIYPLNSKKSAGLPAVTGDGWNEGLPGGKLPVLSWASDYYLNWQAVNGTNVEIQAGLAAANWGVSMLGGMIGGAQDDGNTGGMIGATLGLADQVRGIAQQIRQAEMVPPTAKGNVSAGSLALSCGELRFTFRKMSIRAEYARIIDSYFDAFGYKVSAFKVPNITGRQNWNYVKTIGCNITGNVPQVAIEGIKAIFNTGTTVWHNTATFMDYSQNNSIVN